MSLKKCLARNTRKQVDGAVPTEKDLRAFKKSRIIDNKFPDSWQMYSVSKMVKKNSIYLSRP